MRVPVDELEVAIRAYADIARERREPQVVHPSNWYVVFDCETTADAAQQLRIGAYQVRHGSTLEEAGLFWDPLALSPAERSLLHRYAIEKGLKLLTRSEFIEDVLFRVLVDLEGTCIAFNAPFDISRIAIDHAPAKRNMRGGFSFRLSENRRFPRIQVKHLSARAALVRLSGGMNPTPQAMRNRGLRVPTRRGHFVDVKTVAGALLGGGHSLETLSAELKTAHRKSRSEDHGQTLRRKYLDYATNDVQVTWECFERLQALYASYGLSTPLSQIYSEASIGKAYLRDMGIRPWHERQPDFPPEVLGYILSSYFGGRSEVRLRREIAEVLYCDFLSMYPSVCTLLGLWRFAIAEGIDHEDATAEVRTLLRRVRATDLKDRAFWSKLRVLVEIAPEGDILPVRARYPHADSYTIGLNHFTSDGRFWYTLADCIASTLLVGRPPKVVRALRFTPREVQPGLRPVEIAGNADYKVDPAGDDFFRRLIDLRIAVKDDEEGAKASGDKERADRLHAEQQMLKTLASSTSYGIFVELNVQERARRTSVRWYGRDGTPQVRLMRSIEEPGRFFHPLLGTLITGGSRLMLALAELQARKERIGWAAVDTDSMSLARPKGMGRREFRTRGERVQGWFTSLNPYATPGPLFKVEQHNYRVERKKVTKQRETLYCFAVSDKRYALFNRGPDGGPLLRKVSAHGLGHLRPPYDKKHAPRRIPAPIVAIEDLEAERWQHDLWYRIAEAAHSADPETVELRDLPGFDVPAVTRYAASNPTLLGWFGKYNEGRPYREQVRPFGFMLAFQHRFIPERDPDDLPLVVAPYDSDPLKAVRHAFDRRRPNVRIAITDLKTYREALSIYHLHPELKFHNGDYTDRGETYRRRVRDAKVTHIGKEAHLWEQQYFLGADPDAQIHYGSTAADLDRLRVVVAAQIRKHAPTDVAEAAGLSLAEVSSVRTGRRRPTESTLLKMREALPKLHAQHEEREQSERFLLTRVRREVSRTSLRRVAAVAGVDKANLQRVLAGRRPLTKAMCERLARSYASRRMTNRDAARAPPASCHQAARTTRSPSTRCYCIEVPRRRYV